MKIRGHGNAVAISLAGLAVVMAATGTAVAVTASTVKIADAKSRTHVARVDASGRLAVGGPLSRLHGHVFTFSGETDPVFSPTMASIAVSSISYDNSYNIIYGNTDYDVALEKITVGSNGTCTDTDATRTVYRTDGLRQGATVSESFPSPLLFKPTGSKPYCVGVKVDFTDASHAAPFYAAGISIGGFVASGTYSGVGTAARPAPMSADVRPTLKR